MPCQCPVARQLPHAAAPCRAICRSPRLLGRHTLRQSRPRPQCRETLSGPSKTRDRQKHCRDRFGVILMARHAQLLKRRGRMRPRGWFLHTGAWVSRSITQPNGRWTRALTSSSDTRMDHRSMTSGRRAAARQGDVTARHCSSGLCCAPRGYAAQNPATRPSHVCCAALQEQPRWHNGTADFIDLEKGRMWYSS